MFKPIVMLSAITLFVLTPIPGTGPQAQEPAGATAHAHVKVTAESQAKAKKLYAVDCAMCHADNGNGKTDLSADMKLALDDWSNPATLANKSDDALFGMIRKGKDKMPAEDAARAKDDEVWNLIVYIRNMPKNAAPPAPAAAPSN